jgi:hypothetical protein
MFGTEAGCAFLKDTTPKRDRESNKSYKKEKRGARKSKNLDSDTSRNTA